MTSSPLRRCATMLAGWGLLFLGTPGQLTPDGSLLLAIAGVGVWGRAVLRPLGPRPLRALLAEGLANAIGTASTVWWVAYVVPPGVLYIGLGMALYFALGCGLGRVVARRFSAPIAVAAAFWVGEALRTVLPPPLGLPWFQLGHHAHHHLALSGSARVWGVEGLSLVVALCAGTVTACLAWRDAAPRLRTFVPAGVALVAALAAAALTSPPPTLVGPRVLVVQPGFEQDEKQYRSWEENHDELVARTLAAAEELVQRGERAADVVAWGETMLQLWLFEPGVDEALARGVNAPPWRPPLTAATVAGWRRAEEQLVRRDLLSRLPPGTSFLAGAVVWDEVGEASASTAELRPRNAVVLYDAQGRRAPAISKRFLVPGAETMHGLERFALVRDVIDHFAGYVPDFAAAEETGVLVLPVRAPDPAAGGAARERYRIGVSVCFDNGFVQPYVEPPLAGPLDFHAVFSNEAWYREAFEVDQMLALSRVAAIASGRAILRATNSGISALLGPDGRELARLVVDGRDRLVAGTLVVDVPVPADAEAAPPPYGRLRTPLRVALGLLALLLWALARGRSGARAQSGPQEA